MTAKQDASKKDETFVPKTRDIVGGVFGPVKDYGKISAQLPADDFEYHLAFPGFRKHIRSDSENLIQLMDACGNFLPKRRRAKLETEEDPHSGALTLLESQRTAVMEAVDSLLENVDSLLDEVKGQKLRAEQQLAVTFGSELVTSSGDAGNSGSGGVVRLAHVMRPQLTFTVPVDNSLDPFVPVYSDAEGVMRTGSAGVHPFERAIKEFVIPEHQMVPKAETPSVPLEQCPLRFVDTPEELAAVAAVLAKEKEIAIDLEHHDFYSFLGFTCLMQISSRTEDFIIDCLKLRSSMHLLAPVLLDGSILKVLHGAKEDVRWLQKDFSLYLVNFFDTGIALQTLHMPYSLAFAVDHFCQVKLNKKYQTADWRVRPLPVEMVHYARQDTHFLLYIYDRLKALLINTEGRASIGNLLAHVYSESKQLSLSIYEKPPLVLEETYKLALGRSLGGLSSVQEEVAKEVFNWRDAAAREADDSPAAVLHLSSVLAIASKLPTSAREVLRCCGVATAVLRKNVGTLVAIVQKAVSANMGSGGMTGAASHPLIHPLPHGGGEGPSLDCGAAHLTEWSFFAGHVPRGVYRPMTGALPSLMSATRSSLPADLASSAKEEDEGRLYASTPSAWFSCMKRAGSAPKRRVAPAVPLPGHDVLLAMRETVAPATAAAHGRKELQKEEAVTNENEDEEDASSVDGEAQVEGTQASTVNAVELHEEEEKIALPVDQRAVIMKKAYGTGSKNRKAAKKSKK